MWLLYTSGICIARLFPEAGTLLCEALDTSRAEFLPKKPLTQEENARFERMTHLNLFQLFETLPEYDRLFSAGGAEVITSAGERFVRDSGDYYVQRELRFPHNAVLKNGRTVAFLSPSRERIHVLVEEGCEDLTVIGAWLRDYPEAIRPVRHLPVSTVVTRDGAELSTAVMLPGEGMQPVPTILVRTPYGKEDDLPLYERYVHRGYAVVIQDVRGRNLSTGDWIPDHFEVEDGDDTLNWIAAQSWSDGNVGMLGGSYLGYVQWAAAASGNPHLKALVSVVCAGSAFVDLPRRGGTFSSGELAWAFSVSGRKYEPALMDRDDWDEVLDIRPLADIPKRALGYDIPFWTEYFKHQDCDPFWAKGNWRERGRGVVEVPALIMSGWFDDNGMGTTEALDLTADYPAGRRKIILGPWQHGGNSKYNLHGMAMANNALKFDIDLTFLKWFDFHLKGVCSGADRMPTVEYYTLGENRWKTADNWPIPESEPFFLYLTSGGGANTSGGDGVLRFGEVSADNCDGFTYDPKDPAVHIIDLSENELSVPEDYTEEEKRRDVLCYTTAVLEEPITLTGDFTVELYVSSDAPDTDFVVRICDVDAFGRSVKLADGAVCARYRNGYEKGEFMEPGKIYKLSIRTTKLSNCFLKGHRIRLTVTSGAKNMLFPNSNTREGFNSSVTALAENCLHHGGVCPSKVIARREV